MHSGKLGRPEAPASCAVHPTGRVRSRIVAQWSCLNAERTKQSPAVRTPRYSERTYVSASAVRSASSAGRLDRRAAWEDQDLVVPNGTGSLLDPAWRRVVFKEGLRHTAATMVLTQGVHPKVVSEMLGHATIRLTLDTWSHLVPVLRAQAADAMDVLLGPRLRKPQRSWVASGVPPAWCK